LQRCDIPTPKPRSIRARIPRQLFRDRPATAQRGAARHLVIPHHRPRQPASPLSIAIQPGSTLAAIGDATDASLRIVDLENHEATVRIKLAGRPEDLAWSTDGRTVFVAEAGASSIAEVRANHAKIHRRIATGRYPSGIALADQKGLLLATDRGLNHLAIIHLTDGKTLHRIPVGTQPGFVAVTPDESLAVVSNLIPATAATAQDHATEITLVDLESFATRASIRLPTGSTNARSIAIAPDGTHAYVAHTIGRFHLPTTQLDCGWVNTNALTGKLWAAQAAVAVGSKHGLFLLLGVAQPPATIGPYDCFIEFIRISHSNETYDINAPRRRESSNGATELAYSSTSASASSSLRKRCLRSFLPP
jgi:DNA-binding beta-propeller fold protein YncE